MQSEYERVAQKYETKRRAVKDLETEIARLNTQNDRDKAIFQEKQSNAEQKYFELERKYINDLENIKVESEDKVNSLMKDLTILEDENERNKNQILEIERELLDTQFKYERDKALWLEKFEFLQNQKKQSKDDLKEAQRKFELTIEQLQKKESNDKGKVESAQLVLINTVEKKYKDQIREMTDNQNQKERDYQNKVRSLEKEVKLLQDRLETENRGSALVNLLERKVQESNDTCQKLTFELEQVKGEKDRKILEQQEIIERE